MPACFFWSQFSGIKFGPSLPVWFLKKYPVVETKVEDFVLGVSWNFALAFFWVVILMPTRSWNITPDERSGKRSTVGMEWSRIIQVFQPCFFVLGLVAFVAYVRGLPRIFAQVLLWLIILMPTRSWISTPNKTTGKSSTVGTKWSRLIQRFQSHSFVAGVVAFVIYVSIIIICNSASSSIVLDINIPQSIVRTLFPLLLFVPRAPEFLRVPLATQCVVFVGLTVTTYVCGISAVIFWLLSALINLHCLYGHTRPWHQWFCIIFTAFFGARAVSWYFGDAVWFVTFGGLLWRNPMAWLHAKAGQTLVKYDGYTKRFFQGGIAEMQIQFVSRRVLVFLFIIVLSFFSAVGQLSFFSAGLEIETKFNVFCKIDLTKQLECRVDVTNHGSSGPESNKLCTANETDWDFCGALFVFTNELPCL